MNIVPKPGWRPSSSKPGSRLQRFRGMHHAYVPVLTFCVLLLVTIAGYAFFTRDSGKGRAADSLIVIINHDKIERTIPTRSTTVGDLLQKLDIKVRPGDVVEPSISTQIKQDDFRINVYRAKPVQVIDDGRKTITYSAAVTARSVARQAGASLDPEDKVITEPVTDFLADGTIGRKVIIDRAKPVAMNLYGNPVNLRTHADTVGALLKEKNIKLGKDDTVQPSIDAPLTAATQIFVLRKGIQIATVNEDIAMEVEVIQDPTLALGTKAVRQQGSPGKRTITFEIQTENGREVGRKPIQTVIAQAPVKQIEVRGNSLSGIKGNMALAGISPADFAYVDYIISKESRWNPTAKNASSGAYGLCQALPGTKMASAGADWADNPVTQLRWCNGYALGRYKSWQAAYTFWRANSYW